jgi:hypothetical protein
MASHTNTCNKASRHVHRENGDRCACSVVTSLLDTHWQREKKVARRTELEVQWNHETKWIPINLELRDAGLKERYTAGLCLLMEEMRNASKYYSETSKGKHHLEDVDVHVKIILK